MCCPPVFAAHIHVYLFHGLHFSDYVADVAANFSLRVFFVLMPYKRRLKPAATIRYFAAVV